MLRAHALCPLKLTAVWTLYALFVLALCQAMEAAGAGPAAEWFVAAVAGLAVLVWTREI